MTSRTKTLPTAIRRTTSRPQTATKISLTASSNSRRHPRPPPVRMAGDVHVIAVVVTKRPEFAAYVARKLSWQSHRPSSVVICTAVETYDVAPIVAALPGVEVRLVLDKEARILGALRNFAMESAMTAAPDTAILCTIDDDDMYGPDYLAGIVDAWRRHPDAILIGRSSWAWLAVTEPPKYPTPNNAWARGGLTQGVAGATISVPAKAWRSRPTLRYPEIAIGEDVGFQAIASAQCPTVSAYFGSFTALRYGDAHCHTSPQPTIQQHTRTR